MIYGNPPYKKPDIYGKKNISHSFFFPTVSSWIPTRFLRCWDLQFRCGCQGGSSSDNPRVSQMVGFCERSNANLKWMRTGGIKKENRKPPYAYGFLRKSSINGGLFIYVHMYSYVSLCKIHNRIAARVATLMK